MAALAASGLDAGQLALVMELAATVAAEARPAIDKAAENKRAYDREYRRINRKNRTTSYETNENGDPPKVSPKENNQTPSSPPVDVPEAKASSHQPRPWALPLGVSLQVWTDLMTNRRKKRLPNTPTAWKKFQTDLAEMSAQTGIPPPKLIELCTAKGWGAIYDPRGEDDRRPNTLGRHQPADGLSPTTRAALRVFGPS
jgi:hypothetical protein